MKKINPALGVLGSRFFACVQMRRQEIIHLGELQEPIKIA